MLPNSTIPKRRHHDSAALLKARTSGAVGRYDVARRTALIHGDVLDVLLAGGAVFFEGFDLSGEGCGMPFVWGLFGA
jgi:hypothetical protein